MSELESQMKAEEELTSIFSKGKAIKKIKIQKINPVHLMWSPNSEKEEEFLNREKEESIKNNGSNSNGFSNFGHFKPPIKRLHCNPIVKDENFVKMDNSEQYLKTFDLRMEQYQQTEELNSSF
jgi:hypothetical protein